MHYYIIDNKIIGFSNPLENKLYNYEKLNYEQSTFYETYPYASIGEVLNCALNPIVEPNINDLKVDKINYVKQIAYSQLSETDYKVIRHKEQIDALIQTTLSNSEFFKLIAERQVIRDKSNELESAVLSANTIDELNLINW